MRSNELLVDSYFHVDNGGHTIAVDRHGNVFISTGFFGYSDTRVQLTEHIVTEASTGKRTRLVDHLLAALTDAKTKLATQEEQDQRAKVAGFCSDEDAKGNTGWCRKVGKVYGLIRVGTFAEVAPFYWTTAPDLMWSTDSAGWEPARTLDTALEACRQALGVAS
jgi:hypothetical protein